MTTTPAKTFHLPTGCGKLNVVIEHTDKNEITSIRTFFGTNGSCKTVVMRVLSELINKSLELSRETGKDPKETIASIIELLSGHLCTMPGGLWHGQKVETCFDAVAMGLQKFLEDTKS